MPIPKPMLLGFNHAAAHFGDLGARSTALLLSLILLSLCAPACKKEPAIDAMQTDANGYLCLKCGVKLYTDRSVFIGPQCPKCQQESLMDVVGYECDKDHHLTIRPRRGDRQPLACDQCRGPLANGLRSPREKDLKAWGATKTSS
jgi:hypothetical protein